MFAVSFIIKQDSLRSAMFNEKTNAPVLLVNHCRTHNFQVFTEKSLYSVLHYTLAGNYNVIQNAEWDIIPARVTMHLSLPLHK